MIILRPVMNMNTSHHSVVRSCSVDSHLNEFLQVFCVGFFCHCRKVHQIQLIQELLGLTPLSGLQRKALIHNRVLWVEAIVRRKKDAAKAISLHCSERRLQSAASVRIACSVRATYDSNFAVGVDSNVREGEKDVAFPMCLGAHRGVTHECLQSCCPTSNHPSETVRMEGITEDRFNLSLQRTACFISAHSREGNARLLCESVSVEGSLHAQHELLHI
mmetsp:Transcript_12752/g.46655  ORF Transcript_12752/g.46655 Transcript_12752/m.46655 type:complete len:218 (+) Transcript_12752:542-1195(+)